MATIVQGTQALPAGSWRLDPDHSTVGFEVRDMDRLIATIRGRFADYDGALEVEQNGARASGTIRAASLSTGQEQRDEHLRSPQFLDVAAHPEIRFESERIEQVDGRLRIAGRALLKGEWRPLELDGELLGLGTDQHGSERVAISATGQLPFGPMTVKLVADVSAVRAG